MQTGGKPAEVYQTSAKLFQLRRFFTSVTGVTPVTTGGVTLFVGTGSPVGPPTFATFVKLPLTGTVTINVRLVT